MRYSYKSDYRWTADLAYLTGLIAADGCLVNNGRHLNVTSKDIELINHTQSILNMNVKFSLKQSNYGGEAYNLQFSNVAFYDFLLGVGLTPAKSKTMGRLEVPDQYFADFLRGYFDGDGSTYGYYDPRWPKSFVYYICFSSGSMDFLDYISANNQRLFNLKGTSILKGARAFTLRYGKADARKLYQSMYEYHNELHLTRKKLKIESFIQQDNDATILRQRARVL